jgi:hypothetical protein
VGADRTPLDLSNTGAPFSATGAGPIRPPSADPSARGPATGSPTSSEPAGSEGTPAGPDADRAEVRQPTVEQPLDVILVGDSTMDALGASLLRDLGKTGLVRATLDFRVSSGLARPDFFDWPAHLRAVTAENPIDLVVIMVGANDAQPFVIDGQPEQFGTERWLAAYRNRVAALLLELNTGRSGVVWIGQPVMRKESYDADMQRLNQIYADEVAKFPRSVFVPSRRVMSDGNGAYAAYLVDDSGNRQRVRQDDGVHLTGAGGDRLAPVVIEAINSLAPLR